MRARHGFLRILSDTGFGFSLASMLFYAGTNMMGFALTLIALAMIAYVKLQAEHATAKAWVRDPRTPLRIAGVSLLLVAASIVLEALVGTAEASSLQTGVFTAALPLAPLFSAICFGTANILFARQVASDARQAPPMLRHPETYIFLGYVAIGFTSGAASIYALPIVALGFAVTWHNYRANKPVYTRHPLLIYALAETVFATVALMEGNPAIFTGCAVCTIYLLRLDTLLTPKAVSVRAGLSGSP